MDFLDIPQENMSCQMRATVASKYIHELLEAGCNIPTIVTMLNNKGILTTHGKPFNNVNLYKIVNRWKFGKPAYNNVLEEFK